jgi:hypothetical protein
LSIFEWSEAKPFYTKEYLFYDLIPCIKQSCLVDHSKMVSHFVFSLGPFHTKNKAIKQIFFCIKWFSFGPFKNWTNMSILYNDYLITGPFEYRTIPQPDINLPFEYRTSPVFGCSLYIFSLIIEKSRLVNHLKPSSDTAPSSKNHFGN